MATIDKRIFIPLERYTRLNIKDNASGRTYNIAFDKHKNQADVCVYGKDGYYIVQLSKFYDDYTPQMWVKWQEAVLKDDTLEITMYY
jgi:hypothetical protein